MFGINYLNEWKDRNRNNQHSGRRCFPVGVIVFQIIVEHEGKRRGEILDMKCLRRKRGLE